MFFQERHHLFTPMKRRVSVTPVAGMCSGCPGVHVLSGQTITQFFFVGMRGDKARVRFLWPRDNRRLCEVRARSIRYASDK